MQKKEKNQQTSHQLKSICFLNEIWMKMKIKTLKLFEKRKINKESSLLVLLRSSFPLSCLGQRRNESTFPKEELFVEEKKTVCVEHPQRDIEKIRASHSYLLNEAVEETVSCFYQNPSDIYWILSLVNLFNLTPWWFLVASVTLYFIYISLR